MNKFVSFFTGCLLTVYQAPAQIRLPRLIRDSMVLQRDAPIRIWGWATPGEKVRVQFAGRRYNTTTGNNSKWTLELKPQTAGGPFTMTLTGSNTVTLHEILVGDVWLCAGQSNMVHQMALHGVRYAADIDSARYPAIRQFWVPNVTNLQAAQEDLPGGSWKWANPTDVKDFSAVAYYFAQQLYKRYQVPIGIINASWGGTPIEAWMSPESLAPFPAAAALLRQNQDTAARNKRSPQLPAGMPAQLPEDKGLAGKWFDPAYVPKGWRTIAIPGYWEDQGIRDLNGVVWYRREITLPATMLQQTAKVFLGRIVDADALYINGQQVGSTSYMYPQRRYAVPAGLLKPGRNLFVIRVTNQAGKGGFVPDKPYQLIAGNDTLDLTGYWQYKVGQVIPPRKGPGFPGMPLAQNQPAALFHAMLAPLIPYTLKGFAWYQGESNSGKATEYAQLQPAMIRDWRSRWQQGDLPFLFVQLPGFMDYNYLPSESQWAAFREAQAASLAVDHTGMAVAIDLGEWNDIHPDRKKEVGERLALAARKVAYGENITGSGPLYRSAVVEGNTIRLSFDHTGSGLATADGEAPAEFSIAGEDKQFVWAKARIEGNQVVVWNEAVPAPKYVRYAWADMPVDPNLINKEGLPAGPFRTDKQ
jgi:sialate O-acetylesterase